ncbi:hypothetical protein AXF42_Ash008970 [Apostasia shenzhenica]|uniref:Uncharacterized protein n=1 Tax=Apostasia shenzhenica TaxID=1088818 RepID=A0A2I0AT09_9ASPA|nr:hypothetical protein AXF42_Ash008970 [Apostasia shenzhenica]
MMEHEGYTIFKEIVPPPGTVLMKRARRGQPPATQLSKHVVEEAEKEEVEVPEPVCGGIPIDVVSSPDDSGDDEKTLAEVMEEAGKGKEPASLARPKVIPKGAAGITMGEKGGKEEVAEGGPGREMVEVLARLPLILNRALRVEEQMIDQTGQLHRKDAEIEALMLQLAAESSKHAALQEEFAVYKSAMSALKADNKALREKLSKADGDKEAAVASSSAATVQAYKTSLPCRKERLDGIRRAWEGLASSLIQEGEVKAAVLGELDPFSCMAVDPIYKEEGFDLTDDTIQQFFDLLDGISEG